MMRTRQAVRPIRMLGAMALLASCSYLPAAGPSGPTIASWAESRAENTAPVVGYDYALVEVTRGMLPFIGADDGAMASTFGATSLSPPEIRLGVGDVIQITVFESQAGGLFIPREAGARPGNFVELPPQEIGRNGVILVPYAGELTAAGQTIEALEANIRNRLEGSAIEPEVSIEIIEKNFARASLIGSVASPGNYVLRVSGDRILDLIAQAGGITSPTHSTFVTLQRGGGLATVAYDTLTSNPRENIFVAPGDTLNVSSEPKKYYVFGAAGIIGEFDFNDAEMDLRGALGFAAGLLDSRADPSEVLIYRRETRGALEAMGVDVADIPESETMVPTIYQVDFRKPDSFFLASEFQLRDGDVIYISNARFVDISKFFNLATTVSGGTVQVDGDIQALHD